MRTEHGVSVPRSSNYNVPLMRATIAILALALFAMSASAATPVDLDKLTKDQIVDGFTVDSVYLNDADKPIGARFIHRRSGLTLDLLQIESVPQAHTWVNSYPVSDQGEPHTQEHLLVGKGTTGRAFAGLDTMWLSQSSAYTGQWRTNYVFNTSAGPEVFFKLLDAQLNALLNPDYTDEEIRREVRNFGVTENADHTLRLEEKGSVYNEMTSSSSSPFRQLFRTSGQLVYGKSHPLSYNAGGEPSGIRTMKPSDIRGFHDANYFLENMGTIVALPPDVPVDEALRRIGAILNRLQKSAAVRRAMRMEDQPKPAAAPAGTIAFAEYPNRNPQQPSPVTLTWPATRMSLDAGDELLLNLFFDNIASDATSNLYKKFIDSKTRTIDIGAKSVGNRVSADQGHPVSIFFGDVTATNLTSERLTEVRGVVTAEIARIAALPDGSPELDEFNKRIAGRVVELHRDLSKFVNSPPLFGFRNTGSAWMDQLLALEKTGTFRKSLTLKPQLAHVNELIASKKNFWRDALAKWQITGVEPYAVAAKPSPEMIARNDSERAARANAEALRLANQYGVTDPQEAIKRYRTDYDAETARIDTAAKAVAPPKFVDAPPMTIDDGLKFATSRLGPDVTMVASTFENMTSATTGIAFRLDMLTPDEYRFLALLPNLLTRVGVIDNGKPVSFDEMTERLRNEILSLNASYSTNTRTGRAELVVRGAGNDLAESKKAIEWMRLVLEHPDWRPENLPRIRDAVDQSLSQLRNTMQGAEEQWVNNPSEAWRRQDSALLMATNSFLTRSHNALRLRWMLKEAPAADGDAIAGYLTSIIPAAKSASRADLKTFIAATVNGKGTAPESLQKYAAAFAQLSPGAKSIASDALRDLDLTLVEIPDASLAADWAQLVTDMRDDLAIPRGEVLASLDLVRKHILNAGYARMFMAGSAATQTALATPIAELIGGLETSSVPRAIIKAQNLVEARLRQRNAITDRPPFVGLLAPNMNGGVVITSVAGPSYADFGDREKQLDFLASRLFAGYGAHGIFLKTIGAGLAYSNGLRGSVGSGRTGYYAERTPELPQTIRFVVGELHGAPRNASLADYTIAQVFADLRGAQTYEARAEAMAADLADGQTPDQVRKFRQSILTLRKDPNLGNILFDRKDRVYSAVLPGYDGASWKPAADGVYFVIGPDKQLDAYERYLQTFGGALVRLYPRDFWM
jgi:Zn-dependent M16 (insulinase) family peptidase